MGRHAGDRRTGGRAVCLSVRLSVHLSAPPPVLLSPACLPIALLSNFLSLSENDQPAFIKSRYRFGSLFEVQSGLEMALVVHVLQWF